jgi:hypothetical protein
LYNLKNWEGTIGSISFNEYGDIETGVMLDYFDSDGNEIFE